MNRVSIKVKLFHKHCAPFTGFTCEGKSSPCSYLPATLKTIFHHYHPNKNSFLILCKKSRNTKVASYKIYTSPSNQRSKLMCFLPAQELFHCTLGIHMPLNLRSITGAMCSANTLAFLSHRKCYYIYSINMYLQYK